jgi:acetylglutamate kinase
VVTTRPVVVKLGGRALEAEGAFDELAEDLRRLAGRAVLVHGGGNEVTRWSERLGLTPRFDGGRRVTDEATLEIAAAVLAGLVNKQLVAALRARGIDAIGLAALDGGIARIARHPDAERLGAVGMVESIDPRLLDALLARGSTPVLASLGQADGALLNVNADDLAAALAPALGAGALVLLSDAPGLVLGGAVVPSVAAGEIAGLLGSPEVTGGMAPKLEAARAAALQGVASFIASWNGAGTLAALLQGTGPGTRIARAEEVVHD